MIRCRKYRVSGWGKRLALATAFCTIPFLCTASTVVETQSTPLQTFNYYLKAFTRGDIDAFTTYIQLRSAYARIDLADRNYASQMLSMYDAMNGRYEDADTHFRAAFPGATKARKCPSSSYQAVSFKKAVAGIAEESRVLMINESHSEIGTRALILEILPVLRESGFRYVAFEALAGPKDLSDRVGAVSTLPLDDKDLVARGYPLDSNKAGFYLREPIFGEIIRDSIRLGFGLVAYDPRSFSSREDREEKEARNLKAFLDEHPRDRLLVIAGYSHIWKNGGWMADRLRKMGDYRITSVDQIDGWGGCEGTKGLKSYPYILKRKDSNSKYWAYQAGTDLTVLNVLNNERGVKGSWLTLNGSRRQVTLPNSICNERVPCMVSATSISELPNAVPADRLVVLGSEKPILYLSLGTYRLSTQTKEAKLMWNLVVGSKGMSLAPAKTHTNSHQTALGDSP
jgi:hypothetical protein